MRVFVGPQDGAFDRLVSAGSGVLGQSPSVRGATTHFSIFCMPNLLPDGAQVAQVLLQRCEDDYEAQCAWFGIRPPHFNVTLAGLSQFLDGTGGAFHPDCSSGAIYSDVKLNPVSDAYLTAALVVAETVEVFEAIQNLGWDCGASHGEGLSRVLAAERYPKVTDSYSTAAIWLDGGRPDWVNATNYTDRNPSSNGCAVLFLNWLNSQLKYGWDKICRAGGSTLAETYQRLTGRNDGWSQFRQLLDTRFPLGQPSKLETDNPFRP